MKLSSLLIIFFNVLNDIKDNFLLDGVTFSGGDPLFQAKELIDLAKNIIDLGLNIWIYTGFRFEEILDALNNKTSRINKDMLELIKLVDVVVDGEYMQDKRTLTLPFRGSTNQRLVDCKKSLSENRIIEKEILKWFSYALWEEVDQVRA